jgi:hypothetical protein
MITKGGHINNAPIKEALDISTMRNIDVSHMTAEQLLEKINEGELAISFSDAYSDGDANIEMGDFSSSEIEI